MDDLTAMISQVLADPAAMRQLQSVAASLGLGGTESQSPATGPAPTTPEPEAQSPPATEAASGGQSLSGGSASGGLDLSALLSMLGSQPAAPAQPPQSGGVDLSALSGLLGGLMGGGSPPAAGSQPAQNGTAALAALLGSGANSGQSGGQTAIPGLPFDMGTLLKLRQAMSGLQANQANVQLLMALKPRLKPERAKKVDDAVRVMQLVQFLPLIKESGLFGDLGSTLSGLIGGRRQS